MLSTADPSLKSNASCRCRFLTSLFNGIRRTLFPSPPPPMTFSPPWATFERVFRYLDADGDGRISATELCLCLKTAGEEVSPAEVEAVVGSSGSDGDGSLGYEDFVRLVDADEEDDRGWALREAFGAYEMEGRGCITTRSLRRGLRRLGEDRTVEECRDVIGKFDVDGDGVISFEEFKLLML
ncbi:hypothetical protein HPP92_019674 [Vanilla planifolia]|uniref:EF-hand domain-containing protein n=1 Tax=Vanilla planifolia TaxID=51239 RepID=A0A835Q774_VANPL|nr:hypothetical protein HPP92_019674 [Vanilla planifolia]